MKTKKIFYILVFIVVVFFVYLVFVGKKVETEKKEKTITKIDVINTLYKKLQQKYKDNYPIPTDSNMVLLDKNLRQIHLEDSNISLENVKNLYAIQANTCFLGDDVEFKDIYFDKEFSIGENKKCFSYVVTKDRKNIQLWAVIYENGKYKAYLVGNVDHSITKDIYSNNLVKNGSTKYLPYLPEYNNKVYFQIDWGTWKVYLTQGGITKEYDIAYFKKWKYLPLVDIPEIKDLSIKIIWEKFVAKLVYPDGNITYLRWTMKNPVELSIAKYNFNGMNTEANVINKLWQIAYNLVKFSSNTDYQLEDNAWNVLTIRWTKFVLESEEDKVNYYLEEWKIEIDSKEKDVKYLLDKTKKIIWLLQDGKVYDLVRNQDTLKKLFSYSIAINILLEPSYDIKPTEMQDKQIIVEKIKKYFSWDNKEVWLKDILTDFKGGDVFAYLMWDQEIYFVKISGDIIPPSKFLPKAVFYVKQCSKNQDNCLYFRQQLSDLCKSLWFEKSFVKGEIYQLFDIQDIYATGIKFSLKSAIKGVELDYPILFDDWLGNQWDNFSLLYYHPIKNIFNYSYPYDSKNLFKWYYVVCK